MKTSALRCTASALLLCVAIGCGGAEHSTPTSPSSTVGAAAPPLPLAPYSPFPAVTRPARVYSFAGPLSYQVGDFTRESRFVLYDDRTFALQYARSLGSLEYPGRYTESQGTVTFDWDGWSTAGSWGATATATDDLLTVRYNFIMQMSDFDDAVYRRAAASSRGAP